MAQAQLNINVGANTAQAVKKLQEVKKEGVDAVEEIQQKNREAIKGALGMFAPIAVAIGAIMSLAGKVSEAIGRVFDKGKQFKDFADRAKTSAETMAMLKAEADAAGLSTEQFNQALDDLASGRTSLQRLREEWGTLNGAIDASKQSLDNFRALARTMNNESLKEAFTGAFDAIGSGMVSISGGDKELVARAMQYASQGLSWDEAKYKLHHSKGFFDMLNTGWLDGEDAMDEARNAFRATQARIRGDELQTQQRLVKTTAVDLADADLLDADIERIFEMLTGMKRTAEQINAIAEMVKQEDPFKYELEKAKEAKKKADEEAKALAEKEKKDAEELAKAEAEAIKAREEELKRKEELNLKYARILAEGDLDHNVAQELYHKWTGEFKHINELMKMAYDALAPEEKAKREYDESLAEQEAKRKAREEKKLRADGITKTELSRTLGEAGGLLANVNYGLKLEDAEREKMRLFRSMSNSTKKSVDELMKINKVLSED